MDIIKLSEAIKFAKIGISITGLVAIIVVASKEI